MIVQAWCMSWWTRLKSRRGILAVGLVIVVFGVIPEIAIWRVQSLIELRQHPQAQRMLSLANMLSVRRGEVHFQMARIKRRQRDFERMREHLLVAESAGWPVNLLHREQWLALAQTAQYDAMQTHWQELFTHAGSDGPEICKAYVLGAMKRFRIGDARRVLAAWKSDFPQDANAHAVAGWIHGVQMEWSDAQTEYQLALDLDPSDTKSRRGLAEALMQRMLFTKAMEEWSTILKTDVTNIDARVGCGECFLRLGDSNSARKELLAAIEQDPMQVRGLLLAGQLELAVGNAEQSVAWLERVVAVRPEDAELRYTYGRALRAAGQLDAAREHLQYRLVAQEHLSRLVQLLKKIPFEPMNADLRADVAELTFQWKSNHEGRQWFLTALDVDPHHQRSLEFLAAHESEFRERLNIKNEMHSDQSYSLRSDDPQ